MPEKLVLLSCSTTISCSQSPVLRCSTNDNKVAGLLVVSVGFASDFPGLTSHYLRIYSSFRGLLVISKQFSRYLSGFTTSHLSGLGHSLETHGAFCGMVLRVSAIPAARASRGSCCAVTAAHVLLTVAPGISWLYWTTVRNCESSIVK